MVTMFYGFQFQKIIALNLHNHHMKHLATKILYDAYIVYIATHEQRVYIALLKTIGVANFNYETRNYEKREFPEH